MKKEVEKKKWSEVRRSNQWGKKRGFHRKEEEEDVKKEVDMEEEDNDK